MFIYFGKIHKLFFDIEYILYCGMPDENSRLDILNAISTTANIKYDADVDLPVLANKAENYSGAYHSSNTFTRA